MDLEKDLPSFLSNGRVLYGIKVDLPNRREEIITNFKKSCRGSIRQAVALIINCGRSRALNPGQNMEDMVFFVRCNVVE